jgi:hypothetical protein
MRKSYQQKSDRKIEFLFFILILCAKALALYLFRVHFFQRIQTQRLYYIHLEFVQKYCVAYFSTFC